MKKNFRFYWEETYEKKAKPEPSIKFEIPGFKKDEIKVSLTNNSINVSAGKKGKKVEKGKGFYREEAFASSFSRSMTLP